MNKGLPLVSFVIPTHNRASLLKECLDSVLNQTYTNIEVIVVNDNSSDYTLDFLKEYSTEHSNFYYYNNEGKGGNAARNMGILKAKGEYIAFMDDDDICEFFRIEEQLHPILNGDSNYDFIISGYTILSKNGRPLEKSNYNKSMLSVGFPQRWLIKKELLLKTNLFDTNQPALQDVEFFWRLSSLANIHKTRRSVVNIRFTEGSITKNHKKMIEGIIRLLKLHEHKMANAEKQRWLITLCKRFAASGNWKSFYQYFQKINKFKSPLTSLVLLVAFLFKKDKLLRFHSRIFTMFLRVKSKIQYI